MHLTNIVYSHETVVKTECDGNNPEVQAGLTAAIGQWVDSSLSLVHRAEPGKSTGTPSEIGIG
jgi:hypothetical protein